MKNNAMQIEYFVSTYVLKRTLTHLMNNKIDIPTNIQNLLKNLTPNIIQKPNDFKTLKYFIKQQITEHEDDEFS